MNQNEISVNEQPLNSKIEYKYISDMDQHLILLGNTGIMIEVTKLENEPAAEWRMHYEPNSYGGFKQQDSKKIQYSLVLAYGIVEFINWWSDLSNFEKFERPDRIIFSNTFKEMKALLYKLLESEDTNESYIIRNNSIYANELLIDLKGLHDSRNDPDSKVWGILNKWHADCLKHNFRQKPPLNLDILQ